MDITLCAKTSCYLVSFDRVAIVLRSITYMKKSPPFLEDIKKKYGDVKNVKGNTI